MGNENIKQVRKTKKKLAAVAQLHEYEGYSPWVVMTQCLPFSISVHLPFRQPSWLNLLKIFYSNLP